MKYESDRNNLSPSFVDTNGVKLAVYSTGQTGKPLLYCLHGGPGLDSASLVPGLLSLGALFDLRFIDLRGNGNSGEPEDGNYSLEAYSEDVAQIIRKDAAGQVAGVFGHSFGGLVAIHLLTRTTPLSFGILCGAPFEPSYQESFSAAIKNAKDAEASESARGFETDVPTDADYRRLTIGLRKIYFPELDRARSQEIMSEWTYRVKPYRYADQHIYRTFDLHERLRGINSPCLVIGGDLDYVTTPRYLIRYMELVSDCTVEIVNGAGHFPFLTEPEQFSKQVSQWWDFNQVNLRGGKS